MYPVIRGATSSSRALQTTSLYDFASPRLIQYPLLPHIARQLQHDVPVPPLDAASTRTSTSDAWASSRPVQAALDRRSSLEVMPTDGVTLSDERCSGERTPTRRSAWPTRGARGSSGGTQIRMIGAHAGHVAISSRWPAAEVPRGLTIEVKCLDRTSAGATWTVPCITADLNPARTEVARAHRTLPGRQSPGTFNLCRYAVLR